MIPASKYLVLSFTEIEGNIALFYLNNMFVEFTITGIIPIFRLEAKILDYMIPKAFA